MEKLKDFNQCFQKEETEGETEYKFEWQKGAPREKWELVFF